ncbi:long-chain-fatty-acid--CoA ligase [Hephaestia sp. GCM10023244]|uniref:long-chain-fatty-acid--CoA ligase n=1 Tax=unclassified Hephaestia TaxID=2631281 RepID=UPI0020777741|nr:long-chain-fatty-acid--CoA ligase [Hephaestia sp. MAHUQ-44]MCM8729871.1 long-chain-fatty-acid--CoA ligase [Hephaestia sp. MAHUQ-44]
MVRAQARACGDKIAIVQDARRTSYAGLDARADAVAAALAAAGIAPGERVAVLSRNCDRFYELLAGAAKAGVCLLPLNIRLAADELAYIIGDAEPRLLFVGSGLEALAARAVQGCATPPILVSLDEDYPRWHQHTASAPTRVAQPDDDVLQLYTSGTTGRPKGVVLSNHNLAAVWRMSAAVPGFDYQADDVVMTVMPQFHVAGINTGLLTLYHGGEMVIASDFEPAALLALIERHRCTQAFLVPSMITMLLDHGGLRAEHVASLRQIAYGGSAITGALLDRARATLGCDVAQLYGMTETTGAGTVLSPTEHDRAEKAGSCGRAWPGLKIVAIDDAGNILPPGQRGELVIAGETVMERYWRQPQATAEALHPTGLLTGDGGYIDAEGFVFIADRIKDMIISGGENIAPSQVEDVLAGYPGVRDVAVVGVPSERWGEAVKAFIVPDRDAVLEPAEMIAWARARLAAYKLPKTIEMIDAIPRNASGKVLRRQLRDRDQAAADASGLGSPAA